MKNIGGESPGTVPTVATASPLSQSLTPRPDPLWRPTFLCMMIMADKSNLNLAEEVSYNLERDQASQVNTRTLAPKRSESINEEEKTECEEKSTQESIQEKRDRAIKQHQQPLKAKFARLLCTPLTIITVFLLALIIILAVCVGVLFGRVSQLEKIQGYYSKSNVSQIHKMGERLENQSKAIIDLRVQYADFVINHQRTVEKLDNLREDLTDMVLSYHQVTTDNVTTVTSRLSQLEIALATTQQILTSLNKTLMETVRAVEGVSARSGAMESLLHTLNDSVQLVSTGLQDLRIDAHSNISEVHSSLYQYQLQQDIITSQLGEADQVISDQEDRVSGIEMELRSYVTTQADHEHRIGVLETNTVESRSSGKRVTHASRIIIIMYLMFTAIL